MSVNTLHKGDDDDDDDDDDSNNNKEGEEGDLEEHLVARQGKRTKDSQKVSYSRNITHNTESTAV